MTEYPASPLPNRRDMLLASMNEQLEELVDMYCEQLDAPEADERFRDGGRMGILVGMLLQTYRKCGGDKQGFLDMLAQNWDDIDEYETSGGLTN